MPIKSTLQRPGTARRILLSGVTIALLATAPFAISEAGQSPTGNMILRKAGTQSPIAGPSKWFTGTATIYPIHMQPLPPSRITSAKVSFAAGARTYWHRHPLGQLMIVTSGTGWTQVEGGPRVEINAGDTIWCPPNRKHWHGATSDSAMSHIVAQEALNGSNVQWLGPVTEKQYLQQAD